MGDSQKQRYEVVIEPGSSWFSVDWRALWEYRDLLFILTRRDFVARYKQTLLGPAWFILQPVLTTIVFAVIFGRVAGIPTDGVPAGLFYLCGLLPWSYFSQTVSTGGGTFVNNSHLFTKVYFPRTVVPISIVVSNLFSFVLQLVPFVLFYLFYFGTGQLADGIGPRVSVLLIPVLVFQVMLLSLGISLWMAASTAKYRDLVHLNQFLLQLWMFATPIIYPLSQVRPDLRWLLLLNPMTPVVESFRVCFLGRGTVEPLHIAVSAAISLVILVTGFFAFSRVEQNVADTV